MNFFRRLIDRTRRSNLWIRAVIALERGQAAESVTILKEMERISPLRPHHVAFLGTAHVILRDSLKARKEFLKAEQITRESETPSDRYVNLYARTYLKMIDTNEPVDNIIEEASSIDCSPSLKRWLPLKRLPTMSLG